ncbi:hypothetical protein A3K63_01790 [Candidatus Micrarchaeota archaeon RBG_16_49_10]|nr:MAG: hypothetical protein A3K63_01790 [Candidatus Micrarchaeota archaeon RBG_16_49_10]
MKKDLHAIRGLDEEIYMKFKEKAITEGMTVGEALNLAMKDWVKGGSKKEELNPKNLLNAKPFDWGSGTERTSEEVDKILYGNKK